ncbi:hypothetical protein C0Q70_13375 [Pomacea canaliculata]|uniref:Uncharacterized protein n=1 Tax=Pomacea canaliculata TaxID=400727 RepID=A0A2T7NX25_POMCA|nr:hypothetical protein C0Q70_13375 [Pomacea canaliculata]
MVLKGLKREMRTGNTLRSVCPRADVQKHPQAVIVRTSHGLPVHQADDEADDSHLTTNAVAFSLNKKGRWKLPDLIQERLSSDDFETDSCGLVISMLEHHRVKRQSDCLRVITNRSDIRDRCCVNEVPLRKKARRKMYCNGLNILNNGRGKNTKETRKKRVISSKIDIEKHKTVDPTACKSEDMGENNAEDEVAPYYLLRRVLSSPF